MYPEKFFDEIIRQFLCYQFSLRSLKKLAELIIALKTKLGTARLKTKDIMRKKIKKGKGITYALADDHGMIK